MRQVTDETPCDFCGKTIGEDKTRTGGLRWYYGDDGRIYHLGCADAIQIAKLEAEVEGYRAFAEVVTRCKGAVLLTVNGERDNYESRADYLGEGLDAGERENLLEAPDLYELQFYPESPVGFYLVFGTSLEHVSRRALGILNADADPRFHRLPPA